MSQYPMYPSTQLSYLPAACTTPMYTYPANYMAMLPAMYGNGMTAGNMVQQQQQHPQQTVSPQAMVTGNTSLVDDNSQSKDSRETVTVSSSVSDNAGAPDNVSTVSDDRTEYIEELSREKEILEQKDNCHARRLIDREISLVQSGAANVPSSCETQMVDVYREKPIRLVVKVTVPVKEHPKFNFVGKLLGPKGNSLKRLQEETLTKMAVLGKGSMRDKAKEEEMRMSKDPKYQHLNDELHVEIVAFAPPAEAHARMSYALTEVRKYLIPDSNDTIRQLQMKELEILNSSEKMLSDPNMQLLKTVNAPLQSMQPLLVPSTSYLSSPHLSLLPTPPLDTPSATPTIAAPPTKYETEVGQSLESVVVSQDSSVSSRLKMTDSKRGDRRRDAQPY